MLAPSAFFIIGLMIWCLRRAKPEQVEQPDFGEVEVEQSEQRA
jgi:Na+-transporting NADH:ubiquinone oxidoreductase subunit D